jgi:adenosylcobyric acid synthase
VRRRARALMLQGTGSHVGKTVRFRGDRALLDPALAWLARRTRRPVLGVVPAIPDLRLPEEDSVAPAGPDYRALREREYSRLAAAVAAHVDIPALTRLIEGKPA